MAQEETLAILKDVVAKTHSRPVLTVEIERIHKHIMSQPKGEDIIRILGQNVSNPAPMAALMTAPIPGGFRNKMSASGSLISLLFYQHITLDVNVNGKAKQFIGNLGGISLGVPGGALL